MTERSRPVTFFNSQGKYILLLSCLNRAEVNKIRKKKGVRATEIKVLCAYNFNVFGCITFDLSQSFSHMAYFNSSHLLRPLQPVSWGALENNCPDHSNHHLVSSSLKQIDHGYSLPINGLSFKLHSRSSLKCYSLRQIA